MGRKPFLSSAHQALEAHASCQGLTLREEMESKPRLNMRNVGTRAFSALPGTVLSGAPKHVQKGGNGVFLAGAQGASRALHPGKGQPGAASQRAAEPAQGSEQPLGSGLGGRHPLQTPPHVIMLVVVWH